MSSLKALLLLAICQISFVYSLTQCVNSTQTIQLEEGCPQITYFKGLSLQAIQGYYYRHYATYNLSSAGCNGDGITVNIVPVPHKNEYKLDVCCKAGCKVRCGASVGSGSVVNDPLLFGPLRYQSFKASCAEDYERPFIVDVDNLTNPTVIMTYACKSLGNGQRIEHASVLSKEQLLSEDLILRVFDVYSRIQGFNTSSLLHSAHGDHCPYVEYD